MVSGFCWACVYRRGGAGPGPRGAGCGAGAWAGRRAPGQRVLWGGRPPARVTAGLRSPMLPLLFVAAGSLHRRGLFWVLRPSGDPLPGGPELAGRRGSKDPEEKAQGPAAPSVRGLARPVGRSTGQVAVSRIPSCWRHGGGGQGARAAPPPCLDSPTARKCLLRPPSSQSPWCVKRCEHSIPAGSLGRTKCCRWSGQAPSPVCTPASIPGAIRGCPAFTGARGPGGASGAGGSPPGRVCPPPLLSSGASVSPLWTQGAVPAGGRRPAPDHAGREINIVAPALRPV